VLIPSGPEARAYAALLEEWADEALYFLVGACKWLNPANHAAALANTVSEIAVPPLRPIVGWLLARNVRRRYAAWGHTAASLGLLEDRLCDSLGVLSALLADKPFLLGQSATLADIAVFAQLTWLARYAEGRLVAEFPVVAAWQARLGAAAPVAAALSS
jgi:glutathione S-transferase